LLLDVHVIRSAELSADHHLVTRPWGYATYVLTNLKVLQKLASIGGPTE